MTELKGFKSVTTLVLDFEIIESYYKTTYSTFYPNPQAEATINQSDINDVFDSIYSTIISNIQKSLGRGSRWIIDSVIDHNINIS